MSDKNHVSVALERPGASADNEKLDDSWRLPFSFKYSYSFWFGKDQ